MHHRLPSVALLGGALALAACTDRAAAPLAPSADAPAPNVALASDAPPAAWLVAFGGSTVPAGIRQEVEARGGTVDASLARIGLVVVEGLDDAGVAALAARSDVSAVEPDVEMPFGMDAAEPEALAAADAAPENHTITNPALASNFPRQWNMRAIGADAAWAAGHTGSADVSVAILDTGIGYDLPDLQGVVDLERSVSLVPEDDALIAAVWPGTHPVADLDGHGTNVASQVSSQAFYYAGVTSRTTLFGVKVCSIYGGCRVSRVLNGVLYAIDAGADVINMSLGGSYTKAGCNGCPAYFNKVLNRAWAAGVTVVVSAGNNAADLDHDGSGYKSYCSVPNTICVSATGATDSGPSFVGPFVDVDAPSFYTNYGSSAINVAAPGGNASATGVSWIYSLCPRTKLSYDEETGSLYYTVCSAYPQNLYRSGYRGTSQASPHVAGLAALLVERYGRAPAQIRAAIQNSAADLGPAGTDPFYGKGRIDVAAALGLN